MAGPATTSAKRASNPSKICIVDRREPQSRIDQYIAEGFTCEIPESLVESGDIILCMPSGESIGIEIKTAEEVVSLIPHGLSQMQQFQRMVRFGHRVLLIVGSFSAGSDNTIRINGWNNRSRLSYASVQGGLFNLQANLGFLIRHVAGPDEIGRSVLNIYHHFNQNHILLAKPRPLTLSQPHASALALLMTFPGVGVLHADRILSEYKTLGAAITHVAEWSSVDGIGPKTTTAATTFLNKEWNI